VRQRTIFDPPHNGTPTSRAAARSVRESAGAMRSRVYECIALSGAVGQTREDIEIALEMSGSSVRPRVVELLKLGRVRELKDVTRATSSGRQARILVSC